MSSLLSKIEAMYCLGLTKLVADVAKNVALIRPSKRENIYIP